MRTPAPPKPPNTAPRQDAPPKLHLNISDWLPYLADSDASEAQKIALIETLWNILIVFLDLGWELGDGKNISGKDVDLTATLQAAVLHSEDTNDKEQEAV